MRYPYLRAAARSRIARARARRAYGFHTEIYPLTRDHGPNNPGAFVRRLHRNGWKIIYLRRRNVMCQALSNQVANHPGCSSVGPKEARKLDRAEPVPIDVDAVIRSITHREAFQREEARILDGGGHIHVEYERDLLQEASQQETADRIFRALGLQPVPVCAGLVRIGRPCISEYIANHEELRETLRRHGYEHYLDSVET